MARRRTGAAPVTFLGHSAVREAIARGIIEIGQNRITYNLKQVRAYDLSDPEEPVRAFTVAWLTIVKGYPGNRMKTEVVVPRRTPNDFADLVLYKDDRCLEPYLVVENKAPDQGDRERTQWIEQGFGNANSLRAPFMLYDEGTESVLFNVGSYPSLERGLNRMGDRESLPSNYGSAPQYAHFAGLSGDIAPVSAAQLETSVRKAHSIIWAGGKRDPLSAFDEWSKLLFSKVVDERTTPNGMPRRFQVGVNETDTVVANRVHELFDRGSREDPTIFPPQTRISIPDNKVASVVRSLQSISFTRTDADTVGSAFEHFFGSVFRGELGQYFTRRELARFTVAMLSPTHLDFVVDPTAGSGGFLLEALLQVWHYIDRQFSGQHQQERLKIDFAGQHVYGIEIHEVLARICKINLLLHHDGHTNIEGDRTCLDSVFGLPRLNPPSSRFSVVVGNPPFGDDVKEGDEDHLGQNQLSSFTVAEGRERVDSEHVILERAIQLLEPGGRLGFVLPDGLFNNQGAQSNCPTVRQFLAKAGRVLAVVSLPDFAFRKSGAQNKTSILFFQKFTQSEAITFSQLYDKALKSQTVAEGQEPDVASAIGEAYGSMPHRVFIAEADNVGYTPSGGFWPHNDLYRDDGSGRMQSSQAGTILDEYRLFQSDPEGYVPHQTPSCMAIPFSEMWSSHESHRLDPKYHLFKREERLSVPDGWIKLLLREVMLRREEEVHPETKPEGPVLVLTISNKGEIRRRASGKGRSPPEWLGMYFADSPSTWYRARAGDVVYSSIDLWKGCISIVPQEFDGGLVTKEFPVYRVRDGRVVPEFLSCLLRTRYYQRAFRAITTGHSNRRRTQQTDFEDLEITFPLARAEQQRLCGMILAARQGISEAERLLKDAQMSFDLVIGGRSGIPTPEEDPDQEDEGAPAGT